MDGSILQILLIEDNLSDRKIIEEYLAEVSFEPYDLIHAATLQEGLKALSNQNIDIILLDLNLPDSTGLQTFQKIHDLVESMPIVVLTGNDDEERGIAAIHRGAQDYLSKNEISGRLLARAIRYSIERKRNERQLHQNLVFDTGTNAYSRKYILNRLEIEFKAALRYNYSFGIALCSIVDLKDFYANFGVRQGDSILFQFGKLLAEELRVENVAGFYAEQEFLILFPYSDGNQALLALERIRERLNRIDLSNFSYPGELNVVFGVAELSEKHAKFEDLLASAYKALIHAKELGQPAICF